MAGRSLMWNLRSLRFAILVLALGLTYIAATRAGMALTGGHQVVAR